MSSETEETMQESLIRAFGKDLLDKLDPWICSELSQKWNSFYEGIKNESTAAEKERLDFQQSRFELEADLNALRAKYESKMNESEAEAKELSQIRVSYSEARRKLGELEESNTNLNIDNGSLRRERDAASSERSDLADLAERRQKEIDRLHSELKDLGEKLLSANNAKCEALVRAEEVESKEVSLKYKEQRMEEERDFLQKKISSLTSELEARHEDILALKREQTNEMAGLQAQLASKMEEAGHFEAKESAYKEDLEVSQKRAEELAKRLKQARDSEIHLEENFRQELEAQSKLAQIYKDHAEEEKEKHKELENAIEELQSLLKTSSDKYGELEAKLDKANADHSVELKKRNEAIKALKSELENANGLIKNFNTKGLNAEGIENLSPSAAAASRLIKSGMTLTQIYAQLVAVNEELICEKDETKRLNTYLDQILAEIEERAPILKQQRDDYERAVSAVSRLTERIEEAQEEVDLRKREADDATRRLGAVKRENGRLTQQVKDCSHQIVTLVNEVEALRSTGNSFSSEPRSMPVEGSDADSVITANLVSFRNIEELQAKNAELLSVVRELSEKVETVETHLVEEKTSELRKELMEALKQVEELKEARVRQEAMVDNIISQRDLYKSVADQKEEQRKPQKWVSPEVEKKLITTEAALNEVTKEFDIYRTEKCENEKMLLTQLEKTNKDLSEARAKAAKLSSQEEYNTERFKILQNNSKSYQSQISILEDRNKKLSEVVNKHETSLSALRDSLFSTQSTLSKTELKLDRIKHENDALKSAEARYQQEKEVFYRERKSSAIVTENLKQIQLHLERDQDEAKMRLQNQNESLSKEISLLRKKLDSDSDAFKESVRAWENTQKELRTKHDEAIARETQASDEIKTLKNDIEEVRKELKEANEKLELSGRSSSAPTLPIQQPPTSGKIRDLELLLNQSKNEVKSLKDQLANARQAVNQFKDLANSAEKRLTESSAATKVFREDYERRLKEAEEAKKNIESQLEKVKAEKLKESALKTGVDRSDNDLRQEINVLQSQLEELTEKYTEAIRIKEEVQKSMEEQSQIALETQSKYERELMLHAQNVQLLQKCKDDLLSREDKSAELLHAKTAAEEKLHEILKDKEATETLLRSQYASLKEQFDVLEGENKAVHDRLLDVTTQMTSLQQSSKGSGESANVSFSEEEAANSTQLMQIIKYLRKEKEILLSKTEILQAGLARIQSQKDYIQGQLEESTSALNLERENSSASVKSASKHYELVQKVETLSALMDSNRLLREEKDKLCEEIGTLKVKLNEAFESCNPLKEKISSLESKEETLTSENVALRGEATRWRQRATQLIEKSNKVNPEELKKIQTENNGLKKQLTQVQTQVRQNAIQVNNLTVKLKSTEEKASNDLKLKLAEISKLMQEKNALNLKNNNLMKRVTELENTLKVAKSDIEKLKSSSIEPSLKQSLETSINSYKEELDKLKEEMSKREKEVKEQITSKNTSISKLRTIGRQFKEKLEATEKELTQVKADSSNYELEISNLKKQVVTAQSSEAAASPSATEVEDLKERLRQADDLVSESAAKINELEEQLNDFKRGNSTFKKVEELEKEIEEIREASQQKEQRARNVLKTARQKILRLDQTNSSLTKEISDLKAGNPSSSSSSSSEHMQALKESYESQIESLRADKEKLQDRIKKMVESMNKKLEGNAGGTSSSGSSSSVQPSSSPSSAPTPPSAPDVQTLSVKPMKSAVQPQAHIQPTRQKVSVQPMRMAQQRGASTSAAGVRTSSSSLELPQVSVQPTIFSVSPSSSTNITNLNPSASEFVPRHSLEQGPSSDDGPTPTAMVVPRGHTSSVVPSEEQQPTPGPSSASVPPTPKRPREEESSGDPNKKAKVNVTTEMEDDDAIVVLEGDEVVEEEVQPQDDEIMVDTEEEVIRGEEEEEVIQEEEDVEEDEEEVDDEAEEEVEEDDDEDDVQDEGEVLEEEETVEPLDVEEDDDVVETVSDGEDAAPDESQTHPSSSLKFELDDCVVPSTPRLNTRNEGFSEVVSSPTSRESTFVFSAPVETLRSEESSSTAQLDSIPEPDGGGSIVPESEAQTSASSAFAPVEQDVVEESEPMQVSSTIPTVQTTDRPRISRAPIVWNSPSVHSDHSSNSPGTVRGGARARRSRGRRGGFIRGANMKMPPGGNV